jgi:prepilin-type N-terminal cleavage/methylation domain-containing protein
MIVRRAKRRHSGFTLLELLIVLAIILVVSAIATPNIMTAIASSQLRSAVNSLSSVAQDARVRSVRGNRFMPVRAVVVDNRIMVYVDANNNGSLDAVERDLASYLPSNMRLATVGGPALTTMNLGLATTPLMNLPAFNSRGLPCQVSGGTCNALSGGGYVVYLQQARALGQVGWGALSVNSSGRVRAWTWSGTQWN